MELKKSLIENNSIALNIEVKDWKEAVKYSTILLEKSGAITEEYYQAIIKNTKEYGPYYIIVPEVAMPHARPENGVLKDAFSLVTLKNPVVFDGSDDNISILVTLAATSTENHNEFGIVQVAELFENEENVEKIKNAREISEVLELI